MAVFPRRLQLGAFDQVHHGWLSTDITPHLFVARVPGLPWLLHRLGVMNADRYAKHRSGAFRSVRYLDVSRRFRFPDATFECVYSGHMLEHLDRDAAERCLHEVHRVLMDGGILRLAVPDLDSEVAAYDPADPDRFLRGIYEGISERRTRASGHRWQYNATSLERLLDQVGFRQIEVCEYQVGRCPDLEKIEFRVGSLFVEAVK
ncbi:MAG: methyltransferase domain-containing protein [Thermoleophilaceae bacterium]|jgi:predicted SAM-dependent methyltransferase